jgi:hypothetical protein
MQEMWKESADHTNIKKKQIMLLNNMKRNNCLLQHALQQAIDHVIHG